MRPQTEASEPISSTEEEEVIKVQLGFVLLYLYVSLHAVVVSLTLVVWRVTQVYLEARPETAENIRMLTDEVSQIQEVSYVTERRYSSCI